MQLSYELEIGIDASSSGFDLLFALLKGDLLCDHLVSNADGGGTRDTLHTVHVDLATLGPCIGHELDGVVEDTGNVFLGMIFQIIGLVDDAICLVIIL